VPAAVAGTEAPYRALFEAIDVGFCIAEVIFEADGRAVDYRILEVNAAFERQSGLADAAGRTARELVPGIEPHWAEAYGRVALTGEPIRFENRSGALGRWFDVQALRVGDPAARRVAILFTDISDRRRAEAGLRELNDALESRVAERMAAEKARRAELEATQAALRQAQSLEAIGQLTGGVAHDFNNLLMVISGGLDLLDEPMDDARRRRIIHSMTQATERGASLIRQLLAFARRQSLAPEPIDLTRQIAGMHELLDRTLRGDVEVATRFAPDLWPVTADPAELELVLLNLCVNARDAMPQGGTITIAAENAGPVRNPALAGDFVRLSVIDSGTGMTPEVMARVFEPFFTTKEIGKGSGLGLAQVHGFALQSGGSVEVASTVGQGTTFALLLPRSAVAPAAPERPAPVAGRPAEAEAGAVLLVEDDDEVAALVAEMLQAVGYSVTRAASAAAALGALADARAIDIIFSDVMMPGAMNGIDLAREIRRRRPGLPIVLTSGYADAARQGAEAEGIALLPKPYRIQDLAAALRRARSAAADQAL
jgi:signal transduction histidine kinase/CheY-like chemotaxis protein